MKRGKQSLHACFVMAFFLTIGFAVASHALEQSEWKFDTSRGRVTGYSGSGGDIVVPDEIDGCAVVSFQYDIFQNVDTIQSIKLPQMLEELDSGCCSYNKELTNVELPENLMIIGEGCFMQDPKLTEITIPAQVCYIDTYAVSNNETLSKVTFEGECPVMGAQVLSWLAQDCVIYVPDDQYDTYVTALEKMQVQAEIKPSGKNAISYKPVYDDENLVIDERGTITDYSNMKGLICQTEGRKLYQEMKDTEGKCQ